jgi:hypothetical protein
MGPEVLSPSLPGNGPRWESPHDSLPSEKFDRKAAETAGTDATTASESDSDAVLLKI